MMTSGMRVGLVGPNGSGKTTLLRLLSGENEGGGGNDARQAENLRIVYFDQNRELDPETDVAAGAGSGQRLGDLSGTVIHVASWAARFLFSRGNAESEGGAAFRWRACPCADCAVDAATGGCACCWTSRRTIWIFRRWRYLEESLLEYRGALVLVTHDRYMLDRVSTVVMGLDGLGGAERFADYQQWEVWLRGQEAAGKSNASVETQSPSATIGASRASLTKKKLPFKEAKELESIEERIAEAERIMQEKHDALLDPAVMSDSSRLHAASLELEVAQKAIDGLYTRWVELEQKLK